MTAAKTPAERAARIAARVDVGDDALGFIRARGKVHVVAFAEDRPAGRIEELLGDGVGNAMMQLLLGETWSVCGVRFVRHRGGFDQGAAVVSHFPDEQLCIRCHRAFGDRSVLIFDANQDDGEDPTQIGRLMDDAITQGRELQ